MTDGVCINDSHPICLLVILVFTVIAYIALAVRNKKTSIRR